MGVKGAAIATGISIVFGGFMAIYYLLFRYKDLGIIWLKISKKSIALAIRNITYHCKIGSSTLLGEATMAILIFVGNIVFMRYLGDDGVGAFGIACYYMPFFFMVGNAIAQSAQPIISYNYGIEQWDKIVKARIIIIKYAIFCGVLVSALFIFFPEELVALFVAGTIAIEGFPYLATGILFFIINIVIIGYYQSIEKMKRATLIVLLRGFIILIPCFIILPLIFGEIGIWLAMPVTELITLFAVGITSIRV